MAMQAKHDGFNLADIMVEDILATSDNDIVADIAEDYGDPHSLSIEFDRIVTPIVEASLAGTHRIAGRSGTESPATAGAIAANGFWRFISRILSSLSDRLKMLLAWADSGPPGIFPKPLRLAAASLAAIIVVASVGFLLVREFSANKGSEQTASSTPASGIEDASPSGNSQQAQEAARAPSHFVEVAIGQSEAEAQVNYRALRTRLPSSLTARDPTIRLAEREDRLLLRGKRPRSESDYVTSVGPFASAEAARAFCDGLSGSGSRCTEGEHSR